MLRQDSNHWERDFKEAKDRVGKEVKKREKEKPANSTPSTKNHPTQPDHQLCSRIDVVQIGTHEDVRILFTFLLLDGTTNLKSYPIIIQEIQCDQNFKV